MFHSNTTWLAHDNMNADAMREIESLKRDQFIKDSSLRHLLFICITQFSPKFM